jgi:fructokinase
MNIIVGAGLISLDVLIRDGKRFPVSYYVGGTCGNVMMILAHMGWDTYPIARLDGTKDAQRVLADMYKNSVHTDFVSTSDGKTPVIVQRNFITKDGIPTHKFESRNNMERFYLDFRSLSVKQANDIIEKIAFVPKVFFFDRVSPAIYKLATTFKKKGSVIFFEPSSKGGDVKRFFQSVEVADIIKFSDQRIKDYQQFENYKDKLFIQTQGSKGLRYRLHSEWIQMAPIYNDNIVDTAGAGDWTASALINELFKDKQVKSINDFSLNEIIMALNAAQEVGAKSCSYEGARGMMQV